MPSPSQLEQQQRAAERAAEERQKRIEQEREASIKKKQEEARVAEENKRKEELIAALADDYRAGMGTAHAQVSSAYSSTSCWLNYPRKLPERAYFVILDLKKCNGKSFYEISYYGKTYFIETNNVILARPFEPDSVWLEAAERYKERWKRIEHLTALQRRVDGFERMDADAKGGVAVVEARPHDESSYTEGTGWSLRIYAHSKGKRIKYVLANAQGINAVGDPVRTGRGSATSSLRGVGPVEPGDTAKWTIDYAWHTDAVQSLRLTSLTIEYFDGSRRVYQSKSIPHVSDEDVELMDLSDDGF